jgi:hypothetical protein
MKFKIIRRVVRVVALLAFLDAQAATLPCHSYSSPVPGQVGQTFTDLIRAAVDRPTVNAVDAYAPTVHWRRVGVVWIDPFAHCDPPFTSGIETIVGDDDNDMISVTITLDFNPVSIVDALRKNFEVREESKDRAPLNKFDKIDKYTLWNQNRAIGQVWLQYSSDLEHRTGGAAIFYSAKKIHERTINIR